MEEHQVILNFCKALEKLVNKIKRQSATTFSKKHINDLQSLSGHLMRTEKHQIREENTFIKRLVSNAEYEPAQFIRQQHDNIGVLKRKLERTIYGIYTTPFNESKKTLSLVSKQLIELLRNHIQIEDSELYPQAVRLIPDKKRWDKMREESDDIGYCCFTPGNLEPNDFNPTNKLT